MWAPSPVVRLVEIYSSRLADNIHSCWDAKAGVVDLHDPRFLHFHTDDSIVANVAAGLESGGRVPSKGAYHGVRCSGHLLHAPYGGSSR